MTRKSQPLAIVACRVLQSTIEPLVQDWVAKLVFLDYGLHRVPQLMASGIQEEMDLLQEPHLVGIGYGLCGNGLVGLKARGHTLVIPRTDDCIAMFLGSYEEYRERFERFPGTYYLTRGWLESGTEPLGQYNELCAKYGPEDAAWIADSQFNNYRRVCFVALNQADHEISHSRALEVAEFCHQRWGWQYEERLGSDSFIRRLLSYCREEASSDPKTLQDDDFVIIPPGGEVRQEQFLRS